MAFRSDALLQRRAWQVVALLSGAAAAAVTRQAMTAAWRTTRHEDPPAHPTGHDVGLRDAMTWAVSAAVGTAVVRVLTVRAAASGWEQVTGAPPPDVDD